MKKILFIMLLAQGAYAQKVVTIKKSEADLPRTVILDKVLDNSNEQVFRATNVEDVSTIEIEVDKNDEYSADYTFREIVKPVKKPASSNLYQRTSTSSSFSDSKDRAKKLQEDLLNRKLNKQ